MEALFWLAATVIVYWAAKRLFRAFPRLYLTPLLVTPVVMIAVLELSGVSYDDYDRGAGWLADMVEPATIALAVTLYKHLDVLRHYAAVIVFSVTCGSVAGIAMILTAFITLCVAPWLVTWFE